jgi:hypothetical protein
MSVSSPRASGKRSKARSFRRRAFVSAAIGMTGYGASAQVMIFYLPLFLQNAHDLEPAKGGLAMIPFALSMVPAPRLAADSASQYTSRVMLPAGLAISCGGNLLFWVMARTGQPYSAFVACMLVAGARAGLLNGETVKAIGSAVPPERARMTFGLASTTRYIGILFGVAGLGAILSNVARDRFVMAALAAGLGPDASQAAAKHVTPGDLAGMLGMVPQALRGPLHVAALSVVGDGFAASCLLAAAVAAAFACLLTFLLAERTEIGPIRTGSESARPCMPVDCRHPI